MAPLSLIDILEHQIKWNIVKTLTVDRSSLGLIPYTDAHIASIIISNSNKIQIMIRAIIMDHEGDELPILNGPADSFIKENLLDYITF